MKTSITLIRHGETEWNRDGRWQGHANIPLSELGRLQAQRLAARIATAGPRFDHVYTSDLSRALETAQIIGAALGMLPSPLLELREIDLGRWSGLSASEIAARYPEEWQRIRAGEDLPRGGAESFADLQRRVMRVVERLARQHQGQQLAIVTHGGVVRAVLSSIMALDWEQQRSEIGNIENTSLTRVSLAADGWRVEQVNERCHLKGMQTAVDLLDPAGESNG